MGYVVRLLASDGESFAYLLCFPGFSPCFRSREDATLFSRFDDAAATRERAMRHVAYQAPETLSRELHIRIQASEVVDQALLPSDVRLRPG